MTWNYFISHWFKILKIKEAETYNVWSRVKAQPPPLSFLPLSLSSPWFFFANFATTKTTSSSTICVLYRDKNGKYHHAVLKHRGEVILTLKLLLMFLCFLQVDFEDFKTGFHWVSLKIVRFMAQSFHLFFLGIFVGLFWSFDLSFYFLKFKVIFCFVLCSFWTTWIFYYPSIY